MNERGERRVVARFYEPLRVEALADLAKGLEEGVGAECYLVGSEDPEVRFEVITYAPRRQQGPGSATFG